jgi:pyruvate/2-oxoglutarate dehydrogenase complex dihydrolipoamide acyltransferase (E2) component
LAQTTNPDGSITTFEVHETSNTPPGQPDPALLALNPNPPAEEPATDGVPAAAETVEVVDAPVADPTPTVDPSAEPVVDSGEPVPPPPATPAAVAHAEELGVDLSTVEGTGGADGNLIVKQNVVDAAAASEDQPAP